MDDTMPSNRGADPAPAAARRGPWRAASEHLHAHRHELVVWTLLAMLIFIFMLPFMYHTIPAGRVGVLWKRFGGGTALDEVYHEGFHLTLPWNNLIIYDVRVKAFEKRIEVMSSDGLSMKMALVWRYRLNAQAVPELHKYAGPDYQNSMLGPLFEARARDVLSHYSPEEVYSEQRLRIQNQILAAVRHDLKEDFNPHDKRVDWMISEDMLIKNIELPAGVQEAIVRKNVAFHEMEEYTFRIQKEQKEAERKRIEAVGIRNFQEIISGGMSNSYLRWRGIEATLELAKSNNAKVVVIGNAKDGMPLIMNMDGKDDEGVHAGRGK